MNDSRSVHTTPCLRSAAVAGALAVAAFATGCGGGSPAATAGSASQSRYQQAVAFSECMRKHGVPNFPDPTQNSNGGLSLQLRQSSGNGGISPNSPAFQSAQRVCRKLLPNGGVPPKLSAGQRQQFLNYAACIRAHGVPNFPDPTFSGGGVRIQLGAPGINPSSPAFKVAQQSCRSKLPSKGGFGGG